MYKLCIFDLDGTLADTVESMAYSANLALKELGLAPLPAENFKYYAGDGAAELCRRCLADEGGEAAERYEEFYSLYRKYFGKYCMYQVCPYDGIRETLDRLKTAGIRIAVLSNKPHKQAIDVVETLFGAGYFDVIQGQIDGIPRKPAPGGALKIAGQEKTQPADCLYIGDTGTDMLTGSRAGMHTVGVLWGFRTEKELWENGAKEVISIPEELLKIAGVR